MANIKFSGFTAVTDIAAITEIVGYNGTQNVRISPANFLNSLGAYLPLAGGTMTGEITMPDEKAVLFGGGKAFIKHSGSDMSILNDTGNITITNRADDKDIIFESDNGSGGTTEYFRLDGSAVETYFSKSILFFDSVKAKFGDSSDLQIYHDGSHSYIQDTSGTGDLRIDTSTFRLRSANGGESMITAFEDSSVNLMFNTFTKLSTTNTGINIDVNSIITSAGNTNAGYWLYGTHAHGFVSNANGDLRILALTPGGQKEVLRSYITSANKLVIDGDNYYNVGIGTSSPLFKLQVAGSVSLDVMPGNQSEGIVRIGRYDANTTRYNDIKSFVSATAASNYLKLAVHGGVENATVDVMTLLGSGNVGIGESNPDTRLHVTALTSNGISNVKLESPGASKWVFGIPASQTYFALDDTNDNLTTAKLVVLKTSGNVGIGTDAPTVKLEVKNGDLIVGDGSSNGIKLTYSAGNSSGVINTAYSSDTLEFRIGNSEKMRITSTGLGIGTSAPTAKLSLSGSQTALDLTRGTAGDSKWGLSSDSTALYIAELSTGSTDYVMTFKETSGNVGIGLTSPVSALHIQKDQGTTNSIMRLRGQNTTARQTKLQFEDYSGVLADAFVNFVIPTAGSATGAYLGLGVNNSSTLVVNNSGNVGIGTTTPTVKLHIKGTTDTQVRIEAGAASGEASVAFYEGGNRLATMGATNTGEIFTISADSSLTYGMRFSTNDTERMRLNASGNLSIGSTSNAGYKLKLEGTGTLQLNNRTGSDGAVFAAANDGVIVGTITVSGSATAYNTSSDYRLKEDLQDFKGLDLVSKIPVYDFKWKVDESRSYGVMAHELKKVLPQAVSGDKDAKEMQSVDYSKIVPLLVKSIQELKAEIELLKK